MEQQEEDVEDDHLFSTKGWRHQKSGSAYGGYEDATNVLLTKLARGSCKLIFDKQDRFVHPVAIARMTEKNIILLFHNQVKRKRK